MEQKSAQIALLHREAKELKEKAEKELAEAKELREDIYKKEEELQTGINNNYIYYYILL